MRPLASVSGLASTSGRGTSGGRSESLRPVAVQLLLEQGQRQRPGKHLRRRRLGALCSPKIPTVTPCIGLVARPCSSAFRVAATSDAQVRLSFEFQSR